MKTKIGIIALMLMGSAQATTWLPVSPDSISVSDSYSNEYTLPSGIINQYVWDAVGTDCYVAEHGVAGRESEYSSLIDSVTQRRQIEVTGFDTATDTNILRSSSESYEESRDYVIKYTLGGLRGDFERVQGSGAVVPEWESKNCVDNKPLSNDTAKQVNVYNSVDLDDFVWSTRRCCYCIWISSWSSR